MAGKSEFIQNWIQTSVAHQAWKNYQDLHITEIEPQIKREKWLNNSFEAYETLCKLLDSNYDALLSIELGVTNEVRNVQSADISETWLLENLSEFVPPSLYFYPKGESNYEQTLAFAENIGFLTIFNQTYQVYYQQKSDENEWIRTLFLKK